MAQKTQDYFSHDFGARVKLAAMKYDYGLEGVGFYWCFVEILHEQGGVIKESLVKGIAEDLRIEPDKALSIIKDYGLFTVRKGKVTCERVNANLAKKAQVSEARRFAAEQRWRGSGIDDREKPDREKPSQHQESEHTQREQISAEDKARLNFFVEITSERLDEWQDDPDIGVFESCERTKAIVKNLVESVAKKAAVKVDGERISSADFLEKLMFFFRDSTHEELIRAIEEVNAKTANGNIKNKENYLIATLYKIAKVNGE